MIEELLGLKTQTHPESYSPLDRSRQRIERPTVTDVPERSYAPDRDLTYFRDGMRWTFRSGHILVDGLNVDRIIDDNPENVGFFMGIAESLNDYRKKIVAARREKDQFAKFEFVIEGLLARLLGKLKKFHDQKLSGMSWSLQNGQLVLNGINVGSFLALYRLRKTDKAKKFLYGLKAKLAVLLENKSQSPDDERIRENIQQLYQEIDFEISEAEAPRASRRLLVHSAHAS